MSTPAWFNESYYLQQKATELNNTEEGGHSDWTVAQVQQAFQAAGLSAYDHYASYGANENLNPNQYFDQAYYLQNKAAELNAHAAQGRTNWTPSEALQAIEAAGLAPYEHFSRYGVNEGLNPSASFDVQSYLQEKAASLNASGDTVAWTPSAVLAAMEASGLDPLTHYIAYGQTEGLTPPAVTPGGNTGGDTPGGNTGGDTPGGNTGGATSTFTATQDAASRVVTFGGTATGSITMAIDGTTASFTRGGITATTTVNTAYPYPFSLGSRDTLALTKEQVVTGLPVTGSGSVALTGLTSDNSSSANNLTNLDLSHISVPIHTSEDIWVGSTGIDFGDASFVVDSGSLHVSTAATTGKVSFEVKAGAGLTDDYGALSGKTITGTGHVVAGLISSTDISNWDAGLTIDGEAYQDTDLSGKTGVDTLIDSFSVKDGATLTLTSGQLDTKTVTGNGTTANTTVIGSAEDQTFSVLTAGTNSITGGAGADTITLGDRTGKDTIVVNGGAATSETATVTFADLTAGQSVTVGGLTFTATKNVSANYVVSDFAVGSGWTTENGEWSGTLEGWAADSSFAEADLTFTSTTPNSNVADISTSVAGKTETATVTFTALTAGQSVTVGGLTFTATENVSANDVASAFAQNSGFLGWTAGTLSGADLTFTSTTPNSNVADISTSVAGKTETATVTFTALTAGQSVTVGGLTFTATGNVSANDVASAFAAGFGTGAWTGTLESWTAGTASGADLTFTSTTPNSNVADISVSGDGGASTPSVNTVTGVSAPSSLTVNTTDGLSAPTSLIVNTINGIDGSSDSTYNSIDVVYNFDTLTDKIKLPTATTFTSEVTGSSTGISNLTVSFNKSGEAVFGGESAASATVSNKIDGILYAMNAGTETAMFTDNGNTYLVRGDGTQGTSNTDIVVELSGTTGITSVLSIITTAP